LSQETKVLKILHKESNHEDAPSENNRSLDSHRRHNHNSSSSQPSAEELVGHRRRRHHKKKRHHTSKQIEPPTDEVTIGILENATDDAKTTNVYERSKIPCTSCRVARDISPDDAPLPLACAFDESDKKKDGSQYPVTLQDSDDVPLPADVFDGSISKSSYSKQVFDIDRIEECATRAPVPVGFVFDDSSNNTSIKSKLYAASANPPRREAPLLVDSPSQSRPPCNGDTKEQALSHSQERESPLLMADNTPRRSSSSDSGGSNDGLPTAPTSANSHLGRNDHMQYSNDVRSRVVEQRRRSHSSSSSSSRSSLDIEEGQQYEIVADAVAVEEPDIYDAEPISNEVTLPNIVINHVYPQSEEEPRRKRQGLWESKYCFPVMILIAILIGACMIILGIVLGLKKSSSKTGNPVANHTESTSLDISSFSIDDHSQISNVFYNQTTNHYIIEYNNGTAQESDAFHVFINDDDSLIDSLFFNQTVQHYFVQHKNGTLEDVVSSSLLGCQGVVKLP
jgi:hypothetical protein